jgi:hypothetical protein
MDIHKKINSYVEEGKPVDADFILDIYKHAKNNYTDKEFKSIQKDLKSLVKLLKKSVNEKQPLVVKK